MKTYVKNTIMFLLVSVMLSACGDESGTKTFSTRGNGSSGTKTIAIQQLNDEQKLSEAQVALNLAKDSLSQVISQMNDETFTSLPEINNKDWFISTISNIEISTNADNTEQRFEEVVSYFNFNADGDLVTLSDFLEKFDSQLHIEDIASSTKMLYTQILSEIHFSLSNGNSLEDYKTSMSWADLFLSTHIGQNNYYCGAEDGVSFLIINKPTGLAQTTSVDSLQAKNIDPADLSLFLDNLDSLSDANLSVIDNKLLSLAQLSTGVDLSTVEDDVTFNGSLEKVFDLGEVENIDSLSYIASDPVNQKALQTSLNQTDDLASDISFSLTIAGNNQETKTLEINNCVLNIGSPIDPMGIEILTTDDNEESEIVEINAGSDSDNFDEDGIEIEGDSEDLSIEIDEEA